ncbi:sterol carrier family protein [Salinifilum aidingensis]
MPARRVDPEELRAAAESVAPWLVDPEAEVPRSTAASAVRLSLRALAQIAPGNTVEVRVPPYSAVQCMAGPRHTRGTPPNVVETDPRTWLRLATGLLSWDEARSEGVLTASGTRADVSGFLPLVRVEADRAHPRER